MRISTKNIGKKVRVHNGCYNKLYYDKTNKEYDYPIKADTLSIYREGEIGTIIACLKWDYVIELESGKIIAVDNGYFDFI